MTHLIAAGPVRVARAALIAVASAGMCAVPFVACAPTSAVTVAGTPAGATADSPAVLRLKELLAVVNSGDAAAMRTYLEANSVGPGSASSASMLLPVVLDLHRLSHGLDLVRVATIGVQQIQPQYSGVTVGILHNRATGDLGSMNKLFTGLAIGQLVEQGKLSYDDPLSKFLPDHPDRESARRIRIKQLLSHTSGLAPGFTNKTCHDSLDRLVTVQALVDAASDRTPPRFEPGRGWAYSNFGFVLLGRIIEIVTGEDYYDYMQKNVFAPAGMASASYPLLPRNGVTVVPMAYPYEIEFDGARLRPVNRLGAEFRRGGPSCCGVASALDLIALSNALHAGRVVKPETFRLHSTSKPELGAPRYGYGFAAGIRMANGHALVGHGGNAPGQCTEFGALEGTPYTIIVLSNLTIGTCVGVNGKIMRVLSASGASGAQS